MSIRIQDRLFSLETSNTLYQIKADEIGLLRHIYYGRKTKDDMSYLIRQADRGFSGNPYSKKEAKVFTGYAATGVSDRGSRRLSDSGIDG